MSLEKLKNLTDKEKGKVLSFHFESDHELIVLTNIQLENRETSLFVLPNLTLEKVEIFKANPSLIKLQIKEKLKPYLGFTLNHPRLETFYAPIQTQVLHSPIFNAKYFYEGSLGVFYQKEATLFKLWAPTALKVELLLIEKNLVFSMEKEEKGLWLYRFEGDHLGLVYRYRLYFQDGSIKESLDPYAKATKANSQASVVLDFDRLYPRFENGKLQAGTIAPKRMPSFQDPCAALIYEAHIRDLTIASDNGIIHKGKFLGLTEKGTHTQAGYPTGLDYLKSLGMTHIQFLPLNDFYTLDETGDLSFDAQYNWGYDPIQYNVPEGAYATHADQPENRILEMKAMIEALHQEGLYVIMDVVYNHVYEIERSPLHQTVPGYYFRYTESGTLHNGTGVGNETASEQLMFRKYMLDSLCYWAKAYNVDGFRFDLMGIHDVVTMNAIREAMDEIDPGIILLGEGWDMGNHPQEVAKAHQYNAEKMPRIAFFNDVFRDAMKGDNFELERKGYISGEKNHDFPWLIYNSLNAQYVVPYISPVQNVLYNEAHDNATLYDKLAISLPKATTKELMLRQIHATALQMLGHGMVFIHAGQEILRTKAGNHNSYNAPDSINQFDYTRQGLFPEALTYFKKMVAFRKRHPVFFEGSITDIQKQRKYLCIEPDHLAFYCGDYLVLSNAKAKSFEFEVPKGTYKMLIQGLNFYEEDQAQSEECDRLRVPALSLAIYKYMA